MTALIFLHLPKTAGMTLRPVVSKRYKLSTTYRIESDVNADINRFIAMPATDRYSIDLLMGHMSFGLHEYLEPGTKYVTVLRDPIERVWSEYRFLRSNTFHPLHTAVSNMSLQDYLTSNITNQASNGQTRLLCGNHKPGFPGIAARDALHEGHLQLAINNLKYHFLVAGSQEYFDETLLLLKTRLKWWGWPVYVRRNVTLGKKQALTSEEAELIRSANTLDVELYQHVMNVLKSDIQRGGEKFQGQLRRFRKLNRWYQFGLLLPLHCKIVARRLIGKQ